MTPAAPGPEPGPGPGPGPDRGPGRRAARPARAHRAPVRSAPAGTEALRRENLARVLLSLRTEGPASRAELAQRTGLAKATVGAVVGDLAAVGAVREGTAVPAGRGRPGRPVELAPGAHLGLGLELNVDYVAAVLLDLGGTVRWARTRPATAADRDAALADLAAAAVAEAGEALAGVALAVPGLVRDDERTVAWAPNLDLHDVDLADRLAPVLAGHALRVGNDADCAALAELRHGAAAGAQEALYLTGTVGIGAGLLSGGALVRGAAGFAGEVGHIPLGDPDARCGCGRRGCWEAQVGLAALVPDHATTGLSPVALAEGLADRAGHDPDLADRIERLGADLGRGLAVLVSVLDPEVVVLGGYFVPLLPRLEPVVRAVLAERLVPGVQHAPALRGSPLGEGAAALGAAEQALERMLAGDVAR